MPANLPTTSVVGATTWGTTLAVLSARSGQSVRLLCRTSDEAEGLRQAGEHTRRLPNIAFPESLEPEADAERALSCARLVIVAVPSDSFRENIRRIAEHIPPDAVVLSVTKGLELPAGLRMSEVATQELPEHLAERFASCRAPTWPAKSWRGNRR